MVYQISVAAHVARHHRLPRSHCFHEGSGEAFMPGNKDDDICLLDKLRYIPTKTKKMNPTYTFSIYPALQCLAENTITYQ
ncbi:hypothetical protein MTHERMOG20_21590 [Moorella thermoacetica]|nr:hypothetical protein MTHERMOG20_21590 [Moorella thermoacetica]